MVDAAESPALDERSGDGAGSPVADLTSSFLLPAIEEEALITRRPNGADIAVAVGLDDDAVRVCASALGSLVELVGTHERSAASDLLAVLRPRLVVVRASMADSDGSRFAAEVGRAGAELVRIGPGASATLIAWLVRRAASTAFGAARVLGERPRPSRDTPAREDPP